MEKQGTTKSHIKTKRPITDSEMVTALKNSMGVIFKHFEEELAKKKTRAGVGHPRHVETREPQSRI